MSSLVRTVAYLAALVGATLIFAGPIVVAGLLRVPYRPGNVYDVLTRLWAGAILSAAGVPVRIEGADWIPPRGPYVYISNHQSWFDILAIAAHLPGSVRFVAKKEFRRLPIIGLAMGASGHIFIDRQNRERAFDAYEEAVARIRAGICPVVFPEGTRSRTGDLLPFKKGPFVFAIATQVPLVPIYCANTFGIQPKGRIAIRPRPVTIRVGEPIPTAGLTYEDRGELLTRARAAIERLRVDGGAAARVASRRP